MAGLALSKVGDSKTGKSMAGPLIIVMLLAMMILPLPAIALDVFFTFNIALSILVLLIGLQTAKPRWA